MPANTTAAQEFTLQRTMAMLLLASRVAVMIDYGEEIGLNAGPDSPMQWTPKNVTPPPPPAPIERHAAATTTDRPIPPKPKPQSNVYGPFVPYIPPAKAKPPGAPETDTPSKLDPDTLPGFTSGMLPGSLNADAATVNVAVEDTDPHSLLNFYRKLIQLHHGNASLRNGEETVLNHDDLNALLWVRRPPPGAATATTVVAVCNLSAKPVDLSLGEELKLRAGSLRTLTGDAKVSGDRISAPPGAVWLGEWRR
jgi:alpha-glucosidase